MDLQLLGPVEATLDGRPVSLGPTKQRALLAMLALDANATVGVDRLIDGLWGEDPPATAPKMVQLYVSQLRRLLAGDDAEIVTHGRGYELRVRDDAIDAARFERLIEQAAGDRGAPDDHAQEALALWRGDALADVADEPFAGVEIRRLDELRLRASELAVDAELADGHGQAALTRLERLIEAHPLRERFYAQRMLALYRRVARPRRLRPTWRRAGGWSMRSASSPARSCASCTSGSFSRTPGWDYVRRPPVPPPARLRSSAPVAGRR
jgi:DNA-binding SARP family transcriptional activator